MPFPKTGSCPFPGGHWPSKWGEEKIIRQTFSCLHSDQKKDLIEYFCEHDLAKTSATSQPAYRFPLIRLRDYFGIDEKFIRKCVQQSQEYKDFVEERQRSQAPPPPPEMSLLTAARIAACVTKELPKQDETTRRAGHHFRDREERTSATDAHVVRLADREANGITFCDGLPTNDGRFVQGGSKSQTRKHLNFETDKHRAMVCDMQKEIEQAVDDRMGDGSDLSKERKEIFFRQVEEEERKDKITGQFRKDVRAPYKARAALGLILLLSSVLW
jgi:hypothetical protein